MEGLSGAKHSNTFPRTGKRLETVALQLQNYNNLHVLSGGQETLSGRQGSKSYVPELAFLSLQELPCLVNSSKTFCLALRIRASLLELEGLDFITAPHIAILKVASSSDLPPGLSTSLLSSQSGPLSAPLCQRAVFFSIYVLKLEKIIFFLDHKIIL